MSGADARVQRPGAAEPIPPVVHVLIGVACIEACGSVAGMIMPVRAAREDVSIRAIGLLGAVCYAGLAIRREPPVAADEAGFVAVPRTTWAALPLAPRPDAAEETACGS